MQKSIYWDVEMLSALCRVQCDDDEVGGLVKALLAVRKQKILLQPLCSAALAQLISKVSSGWSVFLVKIDVLSQYQ